MERILCHLNDAININNNSTKDEIFDKNLDYVGTISPKLESIGGYSLFLNSNTSTGVISYFKEFEFYKNIQIDFALQLIDLSSGVLIIKENSFKVEVNNNLELVFSIYHNGQYRSVTSCHSVIRNIMHRITVQYNGYNLKIFFDGSLSGIFSYTGFINNNTNDLIISQGLKFVLDEFRIKDYIDSNNKIFFDNTSEEYITFSNVVQSTSSLASGYRYKFKQQDPLNLWIEGLRQTVELFTSAKEYGNFNYAYTGLLLDSYFNYASGDRGTIDFDNSTGLEFWNRGYAKASPSTVTMLVTNNLIPLQYPIDISNPTYQTWDMKNIIFTELYKIGIQTSTYYSDYYSDCFYSVDGGSNWITFDQDKYTQVGFGITDFRLKLIINPSIANPTTTGLVGWALQVFN